MNQKIIFGTGAVSAVAAVTFLALWALGVDPGGGTSASQVAASPSASLDEVESVTLTDSILKTSNRDNLAICLQFQDTSVDSAARTTVLTNLTSAVDSAIDDPVMQDRGLPNVPPAIDLGCGVAPSLSQGRIVDIPSPYYVFVYVVADQGLGSSISSGEIPYTTEEYMCAGDDCVGVTGGLYISLEDALDPSHVLSLVRYAFGLRRG